MTDHLIGTPGILAARRAECEAAVEQLADQDTADAKSITKLRVNLAASWPILLLPSPHSKTKRRKKLAQDPSMPRVWWVTKRALQQATAWQVARLKSDWFDDQLVYDLCCGIGGDAIHLTQRGPLVAVDSNPLIADMAAANLAGNDCVARASSSCAARMSRKSKSRDTQRFTWILTGESITIE